MNNEQLRGKTAMVVITYEMAYALWGTTEIYSLDDSCHAEGLVEEREDLKADMMLGIEGEIFNVYLGDER